MLIGLISLGLVLALAFLGLPLAFALMAVAFGGISLLYGPTLAVSMFSMTISENAFSYALAVLPMFVLMGNVLSATDISRDMFRSANAWLGHRPGGLGLATVVSCAGFASVSGSSYATAATMARVAYPPMKEHGYSDGLATASIAAGGTLGILIPPSTILVLYGILTQTSIGDLFVAGVLPGVLGLLCYMAVVIFVGTRWPHQAPRNAPQPMALRLRSLRGVWPFAGLFLVITGGIYLKLFTPTEAAGLGAGTALLIAGAMRRLNWKVLATIFRDTVTTTVSLYAVLFGAMLFAKLIVISGMGFSIQSAVTGAGFGPYQTLICVLLIFLVLGCVLDATAIILICVPLFAPLMQGMGLDLVWFGILVVVVTEIGLITPPVGMNVYVLNNNLPNVGAGAIFRGLTPFIAADIVRLALLVAFPAISLFLVQTMN